MIHKFSGVTLDWYDDRGETLKGKFPTLESVPDVIKTAQVQPKERLPNEDFALVAVDQGHIMRKYACNDAGTTAMSTIYFMEHGDKLPEEAQKVAAANLAAACEEHELVAPSALVKTAGEADRAVDITGRLPAPKVKTARPVSDEDYAVVLEDGRRFYPIDTWDRIKIAEQYYYDEGLRMDPEIRRQYTVKLAAKAEGMGYPLDHKIKVAGAVTFAHPGHTRAALEMRKIATGEGEFLEELFEKRASLGPSVFAECVKRFDIQAGLSDHWDTQLPNPWDSTYGLYKVATVVWESGAERVTEESLYNLASNHPARLRDVFTEPMTKEFQKDPPGVFSSLPDPQKKLLSRLANDSESQGGSEFQPTKSREGGAAGTAHA